MSLTIDQVNALRDKACKALDQRAKDVKIWENWYDGDHPVPEPRPYTLAAVDGEARQAYTNMCKAGVINQIPPIVDAPAAKCIVSSLRFGESSMSSDPKLQTIWQRNHLNADHTLPIIDALKVGSGPLFVWDDGTGKAEITVEDPAQMIVIYEAGSRRKRRAALKRWVDDDGLSYVTLYLPDWIYKWRSKTSAPLEAQGSGTGLSQTWEVRQPADEAWPLKNPYGRVTAFELRANPTSRAQTYGGGVPEFVRILTDQKRMNEHVFYMLSTEQAQAFRQRWATDWDYPTLPDGTPDRAAMVRFAASNMASFSSIEEGAQPVRVGEFAQADFRPFIDILGMEVKHVASVTATPPYAFLIGDMINVAADALARIEGAFVSRVRRHTTGFGETFSDVLRCALLIEGDARAEDFSLSVDWIAPEERTAVEQATVARTKFDLGAPSEAVWRSLPDVDAVEAHRWLVEQQAERLLNPPVTDQTVVGAGGAPVTPPATPMERNRDTARV